MRWDIFLSHASEDKEFVLPLVTQLIENRLNVWYDDSVLKPGDSLRRSIENGLKESKYAVIIFSHNFFKKKWTQKELDGFFMREINEENIILPVWYGIKAADILSYSPILADKVAIDGSKGVDFVVKKILEVVRPEPTIQNPPEINQSEPALPNLQEVYKISLPHMTSIDRVENCLIEYSEAHSEIKYYSEHESTGHEWGSGGSNESVYKLMNSEKHEIFVVKRLISYTTSADDFIDYSIPDHITIFAVNPLMDSLTNKISNILQMTNPA